MWIFYSMYCVALSIVLAIVFGIVRLVNGKFSLRKKYVFLCGILYLLPVLGYSVMSVYSNHVYDRKGYIEERVEWATKVEFPDFEIEEYVQGETAFNGDYTNEYRLVFKIVPSQEFYDQIESVCSHTGDSCASHWQKVDATHYEYSYIWGNGIPNPDGELTDEDADMTVVIEKGSREFTVTEGCW